MSKTIQIKSLMKKISLIVVAAILFASCGEKSLTSYVNPLVGTDGHGHTFPGAIVPFGQIQPSPDTRLEGWDGCSGYHYSDDTIYGFSHTHLSGTGCEDYGDLLLMPIGNMSDLSDPSDWSDKKYKSPFSHKNETAQAGYYKVLLDRDGTTVELTADRRVAYHRYSFTDDKDNAVVIDLHHRDVLLSGKILLRDGMLVGWRESAAWNPDQHLHFAIRGNVPRGRGSWSGRWLSAAWTSRVPSTTCKLPNTAISMPPARVPTASGRLPSASCAWRAAPRSRKAASIPHCTTA